MPNVTRVRTHTQTTSLEIVRWLYFINLGREMTKFGGGQCERKTKRVHCGTSIKAAFFPSSIVVVHIAFYQPGCLIYIPTREKKKMWKLWQLLCVHLLLRKLYPEQKERTLRRAKWRRRRKKICLCEKRDAKPYKITKMTRNQHYNIRISSNL